MRGLRRRRETTVEVEVDEGCKRVRVVEGVYWHEMTRPPCRLLSLVHMGSFIREGRRSAVVLLLFSTFIFDLVCTITSTVVLQSLGCDCDQLRQWVVRRVVQRDLGKMPPDTTPLTPSAVLSLVATSPVSQLDLTRSKTKQRYDRSSQTWRLHLLCGSSSTDRQTDERAEHRDNVSIVAQRGTGDGLLVLWCGV